MFTPPPVQQPQAQPGLQQLFVIRLRHARAADVAGTVNALYGRASAPGEIGGGQRGTLSNRLRQNIVPPQPSQLPSRLPMGVTAPVGGREAQLAGETTIVPDAGSNSLLVRASASDFELIRAAVQELDVRPLQVLIEVVIAEARRDRRLDSA